MVGLDSFVSQRLGRRLGAWLFVAGVLAIVIISIVDKSVYD